MTWPASGALPGHPQALPGENLQPGESIWVYLGQSEGYGTAAISVTACAHDGYPKGPGENHVLTVDNINITAILVRLPGVGGLESDPSTKSYLAGCNVTNNGRTTITEWSTSVGVITP